MNGSLGNASRPPDISILMTAYNTEKYLGEAIESILQQQTSRTWELVFVDDGSTDRSQEIARRYSAQMPNQIRVFIHPGGVNRGISASRNLGLSHARGALLTYLDSDDVWLPHNLEMQADLLDSMPNVAMVYASAERWVHFDQPFCEATSRTSTWGSNYLPPLLPSGQLSGLLPRGELLQWFRADESLAPCICTVMMRTSVARSVGGFCDAFYGLYDDQAFYAKLLPRYDVYVHDTCVARYRQHAESCCGRSRGVPGAGVEARRKFESFCRTTLNGLQTGDE
jgi:glycosyltransferase involved in cell wall biosynthesis